MVLGDKPGRIPVNKDKTRQDMVTQRSIREREEKRREEKRREEKRREEKSITNAWSFTCKLPVIFHCMVPRTGLLLFLSMG
jgi:hypothetical protein